MKAVGNRGTVKQVTAGFPALTDNGAGFTGADR